MHLTRTSFCPPLSGATWACWKSISCIIVCQVKCTGKFPRAINRQRRKPSSFTLPFSLRLPCSAPCCDASGVLKINVILRRCAAAVQMKAIKPSVERKKFIFIADYEHPAAPSCPSATSLPGLAYGKVENGFWPIVWQAAALTNRNERN